jgi:hypothetical protein
MCYWGRGHIRAVNAHGAILIRLFLHNGAFSNVYFRTKHNYIVYEVLKKSQIVTELKKFLCRH